MKKTIAVLVLLVILAAGVSAQIGMGGGLLVDLSANNGIKFNSDYAKSMIITYGAFVFFDLKYIEPAVGFRYGTFIAEDGISSVEPLDTGNGVQFDLSLVAKLPLKLGFLTFYPLLGANYNIVVSYKYEGGVSFTGPNGESPAEMLSQLGFMAGLGLDIALGKKLFLKTEAIFGLRLPAKFWQNQIKDTMDDLKASFGIGPVIRVGLGYKFT